MDNGDIRCSKCHLIIYSNHCPYCGTSYKEILLGPESTMTPEEITKKATMLLTRRIL